MPEDYKVSVQSDDAFIPIKSVADGLNIKRFYFENTSDTKKTFQIKFNSQYVIDSALVSIDGNRAERMQSVTSAEPFLVELEAGGKAYVEYLSLIHIWDKGCPCRRRGDTRRSSCSRDSGVWLIPDREEDFVSL